MELLIEGRRIAAMQRLIQETGARIADAKAAVEMLEAGFDPSEITDKEPEAAPTEGPGALEVASASSENSSEDSPAGIDAAGIDATLWYSEISRTGDKESTTLSLEYRATNRSDLMCRGSLSIEMISRQGRVLGRQEYPLESWRAWEIRSDTLRWRWEKGNPLLPALDAISIELGPITEVQPDPEATERLLEYENSPMVPQVPLADWKGRKFKTKKPSLAARCRACSNEYRIDGSRANALALNRGILGTADRAILMVESVWAETSMKEKHQARRMAANASVDREEKRLLEIWAAVACPVCGGNDVLAERP